MDQEKRSRSSVGKRIVFLKDSEFENLGADFFKKALRVTHFSDGYGYKEEQHEDFMLTRVAIPALGEYSYEVVLEEGDSSVHYGKEDGVAFSESDDISVIRIIASETQETDLAKASFESYESIFSLIKKERVGNMLRLWNYIPNILSVDGGLDRYRQFNAGRWDSWQRSGPKSDDGTPIRPAATGIGSFGGPLIIEGLFTPYDVTYIENPRQTQFVHYSKKFGAKPPVAARGTLHVGHMLHMLPEGPEIYISGTASLVGEEVAHEGDAVAQAKETIKNMEVLIGDENMRKYGLEKGFSLGDVEGIRVYIKNVSDYPMVRAAVEEVWQDRPVMYVHDDICRPGFLVEIEGVARRSNGK